MAGTIVCDVISDGAGNSTATDNAIYGSAKAWVNFNGVSGTSIRSSYNVSSVTRNNVGQYTVAFTNALPDANYIVSGFPSRSAPASAYGSMWAMYSSAPTASSFQIQALNYAGTLEDSYYSYIAVFR